MSNIGHVCATRGRPKKKPGYCRDQEIDKLIQQASTLFGEPYDDRTFRPEDAPSLSSVAEEMNTSSVRVRKLLITAGCYSTALSREVQRLHSEGLSIPEIADETGLGVASVKSYLPYLKGVYNLDNPTLNAELGREFRKRNSASDALLKHPGDEEYLWKAIEAFEGYSFSIHPAAAVLVSSSSSEEDVEEEGAADGSEKRFHYTLRKLSSGSDGGSADSLEIDDVIFTKEAINRAYRRALKIQTAEGCIEESNKLDCIGARELYAVFLRIGAIREGR